MSHRRTETGNAAAGFALANLTLSTQRLMPNLDARFTIRNLFDRDYAHVAPSANVPLDTIVQDGRSYWLNLEYTFR